MLVMRRLQREWEKEGAETVSSVVAMVDRRGRVIRVCLDRAWMRPPAADTRAPLPSPSDVFAATIH